MLVTIVTPTFNALKFLRPCLESVQANVEPGIDIDHVIHDAGSNDGTIEMARAFGARVVVEKDEGIFDAINKGSWNSSGELLGFLGGDDILLPGAMRRVVTAYRISGRRWVVGGIQWLDDRDRYLGELAAPPSWMTPGILACLGWNPVMHMATYFSREFFSELGGFDKGYRYAGDYDMMLRARAIAPYARLDQPVACFRRTGNNASVTGGQRMVAEIAAVREHFGPQSPMQGQMLKFAAKVWFNGRNPGWSAQKVIERTRVALGLQDKTYL